MLSSQDILDDFPGCPTGQHTPLMAVRQDSAVAAMAINAEHSAQRRDNTYYFATLCPTSITPTHAARAVAVTVGHHHVEERDAARSLITSSRLPCSVLTTIILHHYTPFLPQLSKTTKGTKEQQNPPFPTCHLAPANSSQAT